MTACPGDLPNLRPASYLSEHREVLIGKASEEPLRVFGYEFLEGAPSL
jgi:hypothetical protein